ncbi:MAG: CopG family antitoxin [Porticoccaceae bacterium]
MMLKTPVLLKKPGLFRKFSPEYLIQCQKMSPEEIVRFLDQFRCIHGAPSKLQAKSKLISLKIPEDLLQAFKAKADLEGMRYQSQIKALMREWLSAGKN